MENFQIQIMKNSYMNKTFIYSFEAKTSEVNLTPFNKRGNIKIFSIHWINQKFLVKVIIIKVECMILYN